MMSNILETAVESVEMKCPVCEAEDSFVPFNGRPLARCSECLCIERNRLMWLAINQLGVLTQGARVLHFAPEYGIASRIAELCGEHYYPCDLTPERYKSQFFSVRKCDLCVDLADYQNNSFDLILHNHVLEHVPCEIEGVLRELDRILAPGGTHLFSVPLRGDYTLEDLSPDLPIEDRRRLFGQEDHMRIFGVRDFTKILQRVWNQETVLYDFNDAFNIDFLKKSGIPASSISTPTSHSMFFRKKV